MTKDMTVGHPLKLIVSFSLPIMLGNCFQLLYGLTDSLILGRFVSSDALAAVGATAPINSLLIGFAAGLTSGFSIPIAKCFGEKNDDKIKDYFGNSICLVILISIIITILSTSLLKPLLILINTPENIIDDAYSYAYIMYACTFFTMMYNTLAGACSAIGDSKAPLIFLMFSSFVNIVLDLIFVLVLNYSVKGVAISSVIATILSALLCVIYIKKEHSELRISIKDLKLKWSNVKELMSMGLPMALQLSITAIGSLILQSAVNKFGANAVAAVSVSGRVERLVNIILSCLAGGLSTFAAQNRGAKNYSRIYKATKQIFILEATLSVGASFILFFFGKNICSLFVTTAADELLSFSDQYLKMLSYFYVTLAVLFVFRNVLQGLGYGYTSVIAGTSELVGRFMVAYVFAGALGFTAICIAGPLAWILADIPLVIIYFIKKKKYFKSLQIKTVTV